MIKNGQFFLCTKNVFMDGDKSQKAFIKGKIYKSQIDDCITDEMGNQEHHWVEYEGDEEWREYFMNLNTVVYDLGLPCLVSSLDGLKKGSMIWRITPEFKIEVLEYIMKYPRKENYGLFVDALGTCYTKKSDDNLCDEKWYHFTPTKECRIHMYEEKIKRLEEEINSTRDIIATIIKN